jgi:hypothetical protein
MTGTIFEKTGLSGFFVSTCRKSTGSAQKAAFVEPSKSESIIMQTLFEIVKKRAFLRLQILLVQLATASLP